MEDKKVLAKRKVIAEFRPGRCPQKNILAERRIKKEWEIDVVAEVSNNKKTQWYENQMGNQSYQDDTFLCNRPMQCNTKNRDHSSFVVATVNFEVNHLKC